jgi:large conductance mechanosensitive channel
MKGFRKFILRGNLVDLAVAVVIGTQFSGLVHSFVSSFVDPLLALIGGKPNLNRFTFNVGKSTFTYGTFLTDALSFLISAAVVYFVIVLPVARLLHLFERDQAATERNCPECDRSIPIQARRCPECTSVLVRDDRQPVDVPAGGGPTPVMGPEG